jgi:glycosyltransferase involved in cell wall biosynthesis
MKPVLFDVSRLFMRESIKSPTGIDRVTQAYGRWLLDTPDIDLIPVCTWGGFIWALEKGSLVELLNGGATEPRRRKPARSPYLAALEGAPGDTDVLRAKSGNTPRRAAWVRYAGAGMRTLVSWRPKRIAAGAVYINVSHFGLEQPGLLQRLRRAEIRIIVMVHDLIPIAYPEYCSPSAHHWHRRRIDAVLDHADLVVTNSAATANEVTAFAKANAHKAPRTCVAPLGLEPAFFRPPCREPRPTPYFIYVGTLEPRKNIVFLLTLWRRLVERMGEATPWLVLAGKRGWETEAIIDHLDRSPPARRYVHEMDCLGDAELTELVAGARALVAPSFHEGFNLPVAEALALGTPVIASDIPVHRELASQATLIDPLDGPAWLQAIEAAIVARPDRRRFRPPRWEDHFAIVADALGWPPPTEPASGGK